VLYQLSYGGAGSLCQHARVIGTGNFASRSSTDAIVEWIGGCVMLEIKKIAAAIATCVLLASCGTVAGAATGAAVGAAVGNNTGDGDAQQGAAIGAAAGAVAGTVADHN
jgi:YMGG-like Gly-zipper